MLSLPPVDAYAIHAEHIHAEHVEHTAHIAHEKALRLRHIQAVIAQHDAERARQQQQQQQQQAQAQAPLPAVTPTSPSAMPVLTEGPPPPASGFQQCVIARESGGQSQVMNASGHYGLYQFSEGTWIAYGGNPADFGHASVSEQNAVFGAAMASPGGASNWAPYDGC